VRDEYCEVISPELDAAARTNLGTTPLSQR
jgi:hypothetical protein